MFAKTRGGGETRDQFAGLKSLASLCGSGLQAEMKKGRNSPVAGQQYVTWCDLRFLTDVAFEDDLNKQPKEVDQQSTISLENFVTYIITRAFCNPKNAAWKSNQLLTQNCISTITANGINGIKIAVVVIPK